jgi:hypothetical protein
MTPTLQRHRALAAIAVAWIPAFAQEPLPATRGSAPPQQTKEWSFYASALGYWIPEGHSYVNPVFSADHGSLHLEARYNYENLETGSVWIGRNFEFNLSHKVTLASHKVTLAVTPMIGGVFGQSKGVAPGYLATLEWRRFSLDSQGEYLFQREWSDSFFYNWTELSYSPVEWFRMGAVIQRTKAYHTDFEIQRGLLAGLTYKRVDFTAYVFEPGSKDPAWVFGAGVHF